jgi:hypothetical protein
MIVVIPRGSSALGREALSSHAWSGGLGCSAHSGSCWGFAHISTDCAMMATASIRTQRSATP